MEFRKARTSKFTTLLNMPKNIILKNQKNSFARKFFKSKKTVKMAKNGAKMVIFWS